MTLLIAVFAAIITTVLWYKNAPSNEMKLGILCAMFWGASLMWLVDAIFAYIERGANFFAPTLEIMINDLFLGLSAVAFACVIWLAIVLFRDPRGVLKDLLRGKKS